jgi:hypothetical protein
MTKEHDITTGTRMKGRVRAWLQDYLSMMEANLGVFQQSSIEGLYQGMVERILEVRQYLNETDKQIADDQRN